MIIMFGGLYSFTHRNVKTPDELLDESKEALIRKVLPKECINHMVYGDYYNGRMVNRIQVMISRRYHKPFFVMIIREYRTDPFTDSMRVSHENGDDACAFMTRHIDEIILSLRGVADTINANIKKEIRHETCANKLLEVIKSKNI